MCFPSRMQTSISAQKWSSMKTCSPRFQASEKQPSSPVCSVIQIDYFPQLEKQLTNQSFVGGIKNEDVIFLYSSLDAKWLWLDTFCSYIHGRKVATKMATRLTQLQNYRIIVQNAQYVWQNNLKSMVHLLDFQICMNTRGCSLDSSRSGWMNEVKENGNLVWLFGHKAVTSTTIYAYLLFCFWFSHFKLGSPIC